MRIDSRGIRPVPPSVRIGGRKVGVNVGRRGLSGSIRTKFGSFNTRRGCTVNIFRLLGCSTFLMIGIGIYFVVRGAWNKSLIRTTHYALRG